jgi:anti-sigma B factor antagonist
MLPPEFSVTVGRCRDTMTLAVTGDLDLATAPRLAEHLDAIDAADGVRAVVIDLRALTFLDSSGIALLLSAARRAEREGWQLTIAGTPPQARYVIELCGLLDVLPLAA